MNSIFLLEQGKKVNVTCFVSVCLLRCNVRLRATLLLFSSPSLKYICPASTLTISSSDKSITSLSTNNRHFSLSLNLLT